MSLYGGIYYFFYRDSVNVQSFGHPSLPGLIYLCTGICVQSCGLPCLIVHGDSCPNLKLWTPLLDWRDVLAHDDFPLRQRIPQPKWPNAFIFRDHSKVVDLPA